MVEIGTIKTSLSYEKSVVRVVAKMLIDARVKSYLNGTIITSHDPLLLTWFNFNPSMDK